MPFILALLCGLYLHGCVVSENMNVEARAGKRKRSNKTSQPKSKRTKLGKGVFVYNVQNIF